MYGGKVVKVWRSRNWLNALKKKAMNGLKEEFGAAE